MPEFSMPPVVAATALRELRRCGGAIPLDELEQAVHTAVAARPELRVTVANTTDDGTAPVPIDFVVERLVAARRAEWIAHGDGRWSVTAMWSPSATAGGAQD